MTARFRQVAPFDGVDEGVGPLQAAAIVPLGGSSLVFLEGGSSLHVASDVPSQALVTEIKSFTGGDLQSFLNNLGANVALIASVLGSGAKQLFQVSGRALAGKNGVTIRAKNRKTGALEAQLQAVVLKPKPMKVSLRAGCFWLESRFGFPNQLRSDSTCWLGGGQQECRSLIRKTCVIA